ncbi:homoserine dehydrogenase [Brevundimonas sp. AAP58]|uniref:amino acid kinase family protein n=1 Tax=Brevundimonas sp. AAP58 TaxID=1523422 RepID=UPI0006B92432|nr:homoserine dehydrogenase [Brevundimonas sp. AAP58]KPF81949.1 homoserine dehydrogenase [Brevundimonas sp. AAP58]
MPHAKAHLAVVQKPLPEAAPAPEVVVLKFGSSILKDQSCAPAVASELYGHVRAGRKVVAVVSALGGHTDRLLADARALGLDHENDLLPAYVAQGEEQAAALVAIACDRIGLDACALSVRELGIVAEGPVEHAHPVALQGEALNHAIGAHQVVIVPGFGAVGPHGRVVLLGRGGSDLTAVFLAAELGLKRARLVKDVDGLYDRDPASASGKPLRFRRASWDDARRHGGALVQHDAIDLGQERSVEIEVAAIGRSDCTIVGEHSAPPGPSVPDAPLKVAIAGCGVVGGGLLKRLQADGRFEVVGVLVRDPKKPRDVDAPAHLFTSDREALLALRPDILLEALSEGGAGHDLIRAALEQGIDVASANKQAISRDPQGLADLARAKGARLAYSAAVGGGSPMIETVRAARAAGPIRGFEAILNGTVNFMLSRIQAGADFADALADARVAGFAEEDPSSDLEGRDSAAKVRLLAFEAFGRPAEDVSCAALSEDFQPSGPVRQIGACFRVGDALKASVSLDVGLDDPFFLALNGERNGLKVYGEDGRVWSCGGRGAGRWPTTESVLADLNDIVRARHASLGHH